MDPLVSRRTHCICLRVVTYNTCFSRHHILRSKSLFPVSSLHNSLHNCVIRTWTIEYLFYKEEILHLKMVRPPSGPPFRFTANEVQEMENVMENIKGGVPSRDVLRKLACQFSESTERHGKIVVQVKQVWNWFQNRRYAKKVKGHKVAPDSSSVEGSAAKRAVPSSVEDSETKRAGSNSSAAPSGRSSEAAEMEFEAKSARDGAWYDVASFITHRMFDSNEPEVQVRFSGFGAEEDEWVNVRKCVRQRSLPCEPSECIAVLPGDLILCFQEGKQQALYFDAHVLDAQRRRHDVRGCRCRFLVRYVHDQCEEVVPLRKICRRPESELRLQSLKALKDPSSVALDPKDHGKESDLKSGDGCSKESRPLQEITKINLQVLTATSQNTSL